MPGPSLTKAAMTQHLRDVARAMNAHDVDALTSLLTDDVVYRTPALTNPLRGKVAVAEYTRRQFRSMPNLHMPMEDYLVFTGEDPARAVVTWSMTGTMTGPFEGLGATGRRARIVGASTYTFDGELISENSDVYDNLGFMQQLGLLPSEDAIGFKAVVLGQVVTNKVKHLLHADKGAAT
jgi:steroid delta-isomerase-like uncharacterized protein